MNKSFLEIREDFVKYFNGALRAAVDETSFMRISARCCAANSFGIITDDECSSMCAIVTAHQYTPALQIKEFSFKDELLVPTRGDVTKSCEDVLRKNADDSFDSFLQHWSDMSNYPKDDAEQRILSGMRALIADEMVWYMRDLNLITSDEATAYQKRIHEILMQFASRFKMHKFKKQWGKYYG